MTAPRADGQTPVVLAASEAYDYWYRGSRGQSHPSLPNAWVIVGSLLAKGARYTISVAAAVGDYERVERLLTKSPELARQLNSARVSPLSYAAREGYTHIVELLLRHGANPNMPEELAPDGRALFEACGGNHVEVADLLLRHGANPNAGVDSCGCCLTIVKYHHPGRCQRLQKLLREFGARTPPYEMSVKQIRQALHDGHEVIRDEEFLGNLQGKSDSKLLELFVEKDPSVPSRMQVYGGVTYPKSPALIRILLKHGLDPNRPDWLGRTFLHACAENGDTSAAKVFLAAGADINARDVTYRETPLTAAVRYEPRCRDENRSKVADRQKRMVRFLLKHGAATNLPDDPRCASVPALV